MLGVVFFIPSIITDRNDNFQQKLLYPIQDIDWLLEFKCKKIIHLR